MLKGIWALAKLSWREHPGKAAIALVLMLLQAVSMPLAAPALAAVVDGVADGDANKAVSGGITAALLVISALVAGHFAHIFHFELGERIDLVMSKRLAMLSNDSVGLEHHERPDYADKLQVLYQEVLRVRDNVSSMFTMVMVAAGLVVTSILLATLSPWLLLLPLFAVPPLLLGRKAELIVAKAREVAAADKRRAAHFLQLSTSAGPAKEVRATNLSEQMRARQAQSWDAAVAVMWRAQLRATVPWVIGQLTFAVAYIGATLLVVWNAIEGRATIGSVILAITLAAQVNQQVTSAVTVLRDLQRSGKTMQDLAWIEEVVARPAASDPAPMPTRITDGITFRGVEFRYPATERPVLDGIDLHLPAGSTVAVVGENGAGKTSLVKLLSRFYDPDAGEIVVDGTPLSRLDVRQWRDAIAAGFQDFARFELRAQQTVGVGDLPRADDRDAVLEALDRARGDDVLARLEDGLDTMIGKAYADGTELSGGQWQKLALGRAMMRDAPLLMVLDEPTSALDAQAEHLLFEQYAQRARTIGKDTGAITVLVSHRFSTVRMADLIVVLDGGRIVESGSHEQLMVGKGLYAELYGLQATQYS